MSGVKTSWADDDELPPSQVIDNEDGTKTIISYKYNEQNKKVKVTQKVKEIKLTEKVHPDVAKRKRWAKFGQEQGSLPGPDHSTTQVGEPVYLRLGTEWKSIEQEEARKLKEEQQKLSTSQGLTCRACGGSHFTSKCPFKDQLGIDPDNSGAAADSGVGGDSGSGAASGASGAAGGSGYVPPHLRKKLMGLGLDDENKNEDEEVSTTLRFSQLNENVDEDDLRDLLRGFSAYLDRVTVVRNRETKRSRGFAYVEFSSVAIAQQCLERFDGKGFRSLILRVEFSKQRR